MLKINRNILEEILHDQRIVNTLSLRKARGREGKRLVYNGEKKIIATCQSLTNQRKQTQLKIYVLFKLQRFTRRHAGQNGNAKQ